MRKNCITNMNPVKVLVSLFTLLTVTLFLAACYVTSNATSLWMRVMAIAYIVLLILFLSFKGEKVIQQIKVIEKKIAVPEKKIRIKEYTGSDYRKVFHKRSCRFSDSIKEENLEESDDLDYFTKKKYKPCGLCHPGKK